MAFASPLRSSRVKLNPFGSRRRSLLGSPVPTGSGLIPIFECSTCLIRSYAVRHDVQWPLLRVEWKKQESLVVSPSDKFRQRRTYANGVAQLSRERLECLSCLATFFLNAAPFPPHNAGGFIFYGEIYQTKIEWPMTVRGGISLSHRYEPSEWIDC